MTTTTTPTTPMTATTATATGAQAPVAAGLRSALPGLAATVVLAAAAGAAGRLVPLAGGPVLALLLGVVTSSALGARTGRRLDRGAALAAGPVLQLSVVLLGTGLSLTDVARTGAASLPVMLGTLAVALLGASVAGRLLGVPRGARTLIGAGTGICGASAIAAVTAATGAAEADVTYAIGTIFACNVVAVLLFPTLGHLLGLSQHAFGLWAGTAVNDTSSVVAVTASYGAAAAAYGIVVKLVRSLMIVPVCAGLVLRDRAECPAGAPRRGLPWRRMVPPFLLGFLAACAVDSAGLVPASWHAGLHGTSTGLVTVALAGIGLTTRPAALRAAGVRPLLLGVLLWVAVGVTSLLLQLATGRW